MKKFQQSFYFDDKSLEVLLGRWKPSIQIEEDKATLTAADIQAYLERLPPEESSDYARQLTFSGKR